ncbi:SAM hydrolase/SAM-dependent halogenase family protein [Allonocardiopsis opalescens]|uniref:SAM-dependent chlorinase/fluorinase n=1 Tax=Allonocardiopsis opalescens TaxID=1144618 RepID=A0A2T0Q9W8_9ACTN|nr:SAM-dependent chlorinase/fluorinase [Allonocardiopsis opalescens]PRY00689.1 hypothetical protein CLV72_102320 [Allonocardiopsis opalescens]
MSESAQPFAAVTFLTDYGLDDGYVAVLHGVVAGSAPPGTRLMDLSHTIAPGDIRHGAAVLSAALPYFPHRSVHVAVVDPGVGTERRAVAVALGETVLIGPDNGLLCWALDALAHRGEARAYELDRPEFHRHPTSATFHGRDIFAPIAAELAGSGRVDRLAEVATEVPAESLVRLAPPRNEVRGEQIVTEVRTVDRFGNVQLATGAAELERIGAPLGSTLVLSWSDQRQPLPYGMTFGSVPVGQLVAFIDSAGLLAVAVNAGNAARLLDVRPGAAVGITLQE